MLEEITNPPWLREGHGPVPEKGRRGYSGKLGEESAIIQGIRWRVFGGSSGSPKGNGSRKRAHESLRFGVFASAEDMGWAWGYVAQTLKPSEWSKIPDALKAVMEECTKFRDKGAWIEEDVMELSEVCRLAKKKREEEGRPNDPGPLRGKIFPLGGVKNSEQAELRKYKGGVAFSREAVLPTNTDSKPSSPIKALARPSRQPLESWTLLRCYQRVRDNSPMHHRPTRSASSARD